jgi:hypothetical protein
MLELWHLRYFIADAEELNFGGFAERLHMAQPPLRQVAPWRGRDWPEASRTAGARRPCKRARPRSAPTQLAEERCRVRGE